MLPLIKLLPRRHKPISRGRPWIYSNEIQTSDEVKALEPGSIIGVVSDAGEWLGQATFNAHTLICGRVMTRNRKDVIDQKFLTTRLTKALRLREQLFDGHCYRLVNAEADGLPGIIIDRYGSAVSLQLNTAGAERFKDMLLRAIETVLVPDVIVLRNDSAARSLEGLNTYCDVIKGTVEQPVRLCENGIIFFADLLHGQKTGWFFDQRYNREFIASLAAGTRLLDCYSYSGGFAVYALVRGASGAVALDTSAGALALASLSADANGVGDGIDIQKVDVFSYLADRSVCNERFDIVVADPPSFVKSKKDLKAGSRGYRKLARLTARLVAPGGFLFLASCSHNVSVDHFHNLVAHGISDARRTGRIIQNSSASPDHTIHPALPESAYLKAVTFQLD